MKSVPSCSAAIAVVLLIHGSRGTLASKRSQTVPISENKTLTNGTVTDIVTSVSGAPLFEFYMYRANTINATHFDFGEINTANIDGVVWYLTSEVVTWFMGEPRCPRKFDISQLNRYRIKTRATKELYELGMNFGVRFAYDGGMCMGRCFGGGQCSGMSDCDFHFDKFGFVPGCNNFLDKYPFPNYETPAPNGIWYSLPIAGRCEGDPTGERDCTWSSEAAGVLTIREIERKRPGRNITDNVNDKNCCPAENCTYFWADHNDMTLLSWRADKILDMFSEKYPDLPRDLETPPCDFNLDKWYNESTDVWPRSDPWAPTTTTIYEKVKEARRRRTEGEWDWHIK